MKKINGEGILKQKLQSNKGETLAETLVAALIGAIGLMVLASMIMSATHSVERGQSKVEALYDDMQAIETDSSTEATEEPGNISVSWAEIDASAPFEKLPAGHGEVEVTAIKASNDSFQLYEIVK